MAATLKDIAEAAQVSIRTAGRALHQNGPVKPEIAQKIRDIARDLHYIPNAAARSLKRQSSRIVGIITERIGFSESSRKRLDLLEQRLRQNGLYSLSGGLPETEKELQRLLRDWAGTVDFLIFLEWIPHWDSEQLLQYPYRSIFLDRKPEHSEKFDLIENDRAGGVRNAIEYLAARGCKRIAHVFCRSSRGRAEGVESARHTLPGSADLLRLTVSASEIADGYQIGEEIERLHADGAFFDTDRMALGFYRYAHEHQIAIPNDIAIIGFDNDEAGKYAIPSLSSVAHPDLKITDAALEIILAGVNGPLTQKCFPTELIIRESANFPSRH